MSDFVKGEKPRDLDGAKGGGALGRTRNFMKEPDAFRTDSGPGAEQSYSKTGTTGKLSKPTGDKSL